jgi:DNA-binding transcriptional ArsR family regulator
MYSPTTARPALLALTLTACLLLAPAAAATGDVVAGADGLTNETVNETADTVENGTNGMVDDLSTRLENGTGETVNETTDTVENTTDTLENATAGTDDSAAGNVAGTDTTLPSAEFEAPSADLFEPESGDGTDGGSDDEGAFDSRSTAVAGTGSGGDAGESGGDGSGPLPDVPPGDLVGGLGLAGLAAAVVLRQGTAVPLDGVARTTRAALSPAVVAGSNLLDRLTRMFYPLRYSRYDDSDPLEHEAREEMLTVVRARPGTYLSEVSERAGLPLSTARYHVRVLEREGLVTSAKVRGRRRFYPNDVGGVELAAAMNDEATARLLDALARVGPASVSGLAETVDKDPSTVTHHLKRLEDGGIVVRERDGQAIRNRLAPEAAEALEPDLEAGRGREQPISAD